MNLKTYTKKHRFTHSISNADGNVGERESEHEIRIYVEDLNFLSTVVLSTAADEFYTEYVAGKDIRKTFRRDTMTIEDLAIAIRDHFIKLFAVRAMVHIDVTDTYRYTAGIPEDNEQDDG